MKNQFRIPALLLLFLTFFVITCKPESINNQCDIKSDSYFSNLLFQALSTGKSYHCGYNLVNIPPFGYRYSNYRIYLNFPVSIIPRHPKNSSYSIQGVLPTGLTFDGATGEIKGTATAITEPTHLTITKSSPGFGIVTITLQVVDTSATKVYGQYGFFNCANNYNNGGCAPGSPTNQNFAFPFGVTGDSSGGVYVSGTNRIQYYPNPDAATKVYGQFGVFNCDSANSVSAGSCGGGVISENSLSGVREIALDGQEGLYAVDAANQRALYYPKNTTTASVVYGQPGFTTGTPGSTSAASLNNPQSIATSPEGGLYISESATHRVLYFPPGSTTATRVYGQTNFSSVVTFTTNVNLYGPMGITLDSDGGLYVVDTNHNRVLYFPAGSTIATRVYGQPDFTTSTGGAASASTLSGPTKVALDQSDNLYVSDTGNNRIVMYPRTTQTAGIAAAGVFGQFGSFSCGVVNNNGSCGGPAVGPKNLSGPAGLYFNQLGQLYVADQGNNRVLVY